jgi:hypothetical protein
MRKYILTLLVCSVAYWPAVAQETAAATTSALKFEFKKDTAPDSKLFQEIQAEARRLDQLVIKAIMVPTRQSVEAGFPIDGVRAFGQLVRTDVKGKLVPHNFDKLEPQLDYFATALTRGERYPETLPEFIVEQVSLTELQYLFTGDVDANTATLLLTADPAIRVHTAQGEVPTTREEALKSLREAILPYKRNAAAFTAYETRVQLLALADDWDAYFEKGRPQTFWDIAVTTLIEYKHLKKDQLVGPPKRQWFVLHPNVVIENVDAAPDGDQLGGAIAIEWIGVNWWNLKVPIGVSVTSLYSDRPGVDDVGHGITLYFANKYCIGWANHGGDHGFYVSIDALKLIDSKKAKLEQYRDNLAQKFGR